MHTKLLIVCVLSFVVALARTEDSEISPACVEEFSRQFQLRDQCVSQLPIKVTNFLSELNATVSGFSGNDEDIPVLEAFFTKYCSVLPSFLDCYDLSDDVSVECQSFIPNHQLKLVLFQGARAVVEYSCDNDADKLKRLIPYGGLKFLLLNDAFDRCFEGFKNLESLNDVCLAIDQSTPCIEETIGDHSNKDILLFVREIINRFKSAGNCGK